MTGGDGRQSSRRGSREFESGARQLGRWVAICATLAAACGVRSEEEQLLARFFEAARLYDRVRMAEYATVEFNPRVDGIVRDFEVVNVTETAAGREAVVNVCVALPDGRIEARTLGVTIGTREGRAVISGIRPVRRGASEDRGNLRPSASSLRNRPA